MATQMSGQEGELKKQLRKDFFLCTNCEPTNGTSIRAWDVFKVLDEVRKEIFQLWEKNPTTTGEFWVCGQVRKVELDDWNREFQEKLEKWFGGEEVKK